MIDSIYKRISTRTYKIEVLSEKDINKILDLITIHNDIKGPFGNSFNFTFNINNEKHPQGKKIGTYGLIKNVPAFIGGVCNNTFEDIVDFGYVFESLLLSLTNNGFDTCWLGGTFKRKEYRNELLEGEIIPAITSVGHRANKNSTIEKIMRKRSGARSRLSPDILFKQYLNELPIDMTDESPLNTCLELVRLGPSASNKQPWRLYVDKSAVHFYLEHTPKYPPINLGYDIQALDIGIAICHFSVGLQHFKKAFRYKKLDKVKNFLNQDYIISVQIK